MSANGPAFGSDIGNYKIIDLRVFLSSAHHPFYKLQRYEIAGCSAYHITGSSIRGIKENQSYLPYPVNIFRIEYRIITCIFGFMKQMHGQKIKE